MKFKAWQPHPQSRLRHRSSVRSSMERPIWGDNRCFEPATKVLCVVFYQRGTVGRSRHIIPHMRLLLRLQEAFDVELHFNHHLNRLVWILAGQQALRFIAGMLRNLVCLPNGLDVVVTELQVSEGKVVAALRLVLADACTPGPSCSGTAWCFPAVCPHVALLPPPESNARINMAIRFPGLPA